LRKSPLSMSHALRRIGAAGVNIAAKLGRVVSGGRSEYGGQLVFRSKGSVAPVGNGYGETSGFPSILAEPSGRGSGVTSW
jgi:hypothetical protein